FFVWDRDYDGPCSVQTFWDGQPTGPAVSRHLNAYDILVRRNEAVPILEKVREKGEPTLATRVSSRKPFGLAPNFSDRASATGSEYPVQLFENQRIGCVSRQDIPINAEWIYVWKVLMTLAQGTSSAVEKKFLSNPINNGPGFAST